MKVIARWQIAYKGVSYECGKSFELDEKDYEQYKNDVIVKEGRSTFRDVKTKDVKKSNVKTK